MPGPPDRRQRTAPVTAAARIRESLQRGAATPCTAARATRWNCPPCARLRRPSHRPACAWWPVLRIRKGSCVTGRRWRISFAPPQPVGRSPSPAPDTISPSSSRQNGAVYSKSEGLSLSSDLSRARFQIRREAICYEGRWPLCTAHLPPLLPGLSAVAVVRLGWAGLNG